MDFILFLYLFYVFTKANLVVFVPIRHFQILRFHSWKVIMSLVIIVTTGGPMGGVLVLFMRHPARVIPRASNGGILGCRVPLRDLYYIYETKSVDDDLQGRNLVQIRPYLDKMNWFCFLNSDAFVWLGSFLPDSEWVNIPKRLHTFSLSHTHTHPLQREWHNYLQRKGGERAERDTRPKNRQQSGSHR